MSSAARMRTLYDDWLERQARLAAAANVSLHQQVQLRVLDFLLHRYKDEAAALEPLPPPLRTTYVNHRAIIFHHYAALGARAGVKNCNEAQDRMSRIVERMQRDQTTVPDNAVDELIDHYDEVEPSIIRDTLELGGADEPAEEYGLVPLPKTPSTVRLWCTLDRLARAGYYIDREDIRRLLGEHPYLPEPLIRRLVQGLMRLSNDSYEADLNVLAECQNKSVAEEVCAAWYYRREYLPYRDRIRMRLRKALRLLGERVAPHLRKFLADENSQVRREACSILGEVGTLLDISLLAALLDLPPLDDEDPQERAELARAMQRIAERQGFNDRAS